MIEIDKNNLDEIKKWFFNYVESFKSNDAELLENILLKEKHTILVCEEILTIGNSLNLRKEELYRAEIIALLHDVGRFEQYKKYRTFSDGRSVNHAELGVDVLLKSHILDILNDQEKNLIFKAVNYHNRLSLPEGETSECLFFAKLIRDADKLDIYRVVTEYYVAKQNGKTSKGIEMDIPETPGISDNVYNSLTNNEMVNSKDVKNFNDFKLLQAGWIFGINFPVTYRLIKERNYLEKINESMVKTEKVQSIFDVIFNYLDAKLKLPTIDFAKWPMGNIRVTNGRITSFLYRKLSNDFFILLLSFSEAKFRVNFQRLPAFMS